jgi:hypothetical protein
LLRGPARTNSGNNSEKERKDEKEWNTSDHFSSNPACIYSLFFSRSCDEMRQAHRLSCVEAFFIRLVDEDQAGCALLNLLTKPAENLSGPHNSPTHLLSTILGSV